jgi:hypothetical protein
MKIDIEQLNEDETRELLAQLSYKLKNAKSPTRAFSDAEVALWNALGNAVPSARYVALSEFLDKTSAKAYRIASAMVEEVLDISLATGSRRAMRYAVRERILLCLRDYMVSIKVPVTARTMLQHIDKLEYAVDQQFPGYLRAGLLSRIVKRVDA